MPRARQDLAANMHQQAVARIEAGRAAATAAQSHRRDEYEIMLAARTVSVSEASSTVDK